MIRDAVFGERTPCPRCTIPDEAIHLWLEGEADPLTAREVESHLGSCPSCAGRLRAFEEDRIALLEQAFESPPLSARFAGQVVDAIRRQRSEERARRRIAALRKALLGLAATAAVVLSTFALLRLSAPLPSAPAPSSASAPSSAPEVAAALPLTATGGPGFTLASVGMAHPSEAAYRCADTHGALAQAAPGMERAPAIRRLDLPEWIEFSAEFFHMERNLPCHRDVNRDGLMDISDAAHLFMLALAPGGADPLGVSGEEPDLGDCLSACSI